MVKIVHSERQGISQARVAEIPLLPGARAGGVCAEHADAGVLRLEMEWIAKGERTLEETMAHAGMTKEQVERYKVGRALVYAHHIDICAECLKPLGPTPTD